MIIKYSKPSGDVILEGRDILNQEKTLQKTVSEVTAYLEDLPDRETCIVCNQLLNSSDIFDHRGISFRHCSVCEHIQTVANADENYDKRAFKALGYEGIYPELDEKAYQSRCERIYIPKANWIIESLNEVKDSIKTPHSMDWCEVGCGAGYFLKSLQAQGYSNLSGFDIDEHNLKIAESVLGKNIVHKHTDSLAAIINNTNADIYVSFFVLEHVKDTYKVVEALKDKPKGTLFAFSVPVFGFITLFESILKDHYPRSLDAMMHTQIYTEQSIKYMLGEAGYDTVSQWVFGQDMMDLNRFLATQLTKKYPEKLYKESMTKIAELVDPMQGAIDQAMFSDARHILAIKT